MQIQKVTIFVRKRVAKRFKTENSKAGFVQNETDNYDYHNAVICESRNLWSMGTAQEQYSPGKALQTNEIGFQTFNLLE